MTAMWAALAAMVVGVTTFAGTRIYYAGRIERLSLLLGEAQQKVVSREVEIQRMRKALDRAGRPALGSRRLGRLFGLQEADDS